MTALTVVDWAAWAPGLHAREDWLAWAQQPFLPHGDDTPPLVEVPAMQRRRIERLGRMAIQAACWCAQDPNPAIPLVFASRHGDAERSFSLLQTLAAGEPLSPTQFGLSVHNAVAALYSILRGERGNCLAIAAGPFTVEAALIEAVGLLADGAPEVLVVVYEAQTPPDYRHFADEADAFYAWAIRVRAPEPGQTIRLEHRAEAAVTTDPELPHGLRVLRFLLGGQAELSHAQDGVEWRWTRELTARELAA